MSMSESARPRTLTDLLIMELQRTPRYRDGEPCGHRGCLSHRSHPCEGCGRVRGQYPDTPVTTEELRGKR